MKASGAAQHSSLPSAPTTCNLSLFKSLPAGSAAGGPEGRDARLQPGGVVIERYPSELLPPASRRAGATRAPAARGASSPRPALAGGGCSPAFGKGFFPPPPGGNTPPR